MTATFDAQRHEMTERLVAEALEACRQRAVEDEVASRLMSLCRDASVARKLIWVRLALLSEEWRP